MNRNIKLARTLIKLAKELIIADELDEKATKLQLEKLEDKLDEKSLQLFNEFKKCASVRTASNESKARMMIKDALQKSKKLTGKALKTFLLAAIAFISISCGITKAQAMDLDDTGSFRNSIGQEQSVTKTTKVKYPNLQKYQNLKTCCNILSNNMSSSKYRSQFLKAVDNYCSKNNVSNMKVNDVIKKIQKTNKNLSNAIDEADFKIEDDYGNGGIESWNDTCK